MGIQHSFESGIADELAIYWTVSYLRPLKKALFVRRFETMWHVHWFHGFFSWSLNGSRSATGWLGAPHTYADNNVEHVYGKVTYNIVQKNTQPKWEQVQQKIWHACDILNILWSSEPYYNYIEPNNMYLDYFLITHCARLFREWDLSTDATAYISQVVGCRHLLLM